MRNLILGFAIVVMSSTTTLCNLLQDICISSDHQTDLESCYKKNYSSENLAYDQILEYFRDQVYDLIAEEDVDFITNLSFWSATKIDILNTNKKGSSLFYAVTKIAYKKQQYSFLINFVDRIMSCNEIKSILDSSDFISLLNIQCIAKRRFGNISESKRCFLQLLERNDLDYEERNAVLQNLKTSHENLLELNQYFEIALKQKKLGEKHNDLDIMMRAHSSLAFVYSFLNDYDSAIYHDSISLEIAQQINNDKLVSKSYIDLALYHLKSGNISKSVLFTDKAFMLEDKLANFDINYLNARYVEILLFKNDFTGADSLISFLDLSIDSLETKNNYILNEISRLELLSKLNPQNCDTIATTYYKLDSIIRERDNFFELSYYVSQLIEDIEPCLPNIDYRHHMVVRDTIKSRIIELQNSLYNSEVGVKKSSTFTLFNKRYNTTLIILGMIIFIALIAILFTQLRERKRRRNFEDFFDAFKHDLFKPLQKLELAENPSFSLNKKVTIEVNSIIDKYSTLFNLNNQRILLRKTDIAELIKDVLKEMNLDNITSYNFSGSNPLSTDAFLLRKVLENLLENSVKYASKSRDLRLNITTTNHDSGTSIIIVDNGIGIVDTETLFAKRTRLDWNTDVEGSGLGLFIAEMIMKKLNGNIKIGNGRIEGTEVVIELKHPN